MTPTRVTNGVIYFCVCLPHCPYSPTANWPNPPYHLTGLFHDNSKCSRRDVSGYQTPHPLLPPQLLGLPPVVLAVFSDRTVYAAVLCILKGEQMATSRRQNGESGWALVNGLWGRFYTSVLLANLLLLSFLLEILLTPSMPGAVLHTISTKYNITMHLRMYRFHKLLRSLCRVSFTSMLTLEHSCQC